jgi:hypothetical protein
VDDSGAETARLKEFEIRLNGGPECRLPAADDHRVEKAGDIRRRDRLA